MALPKQEILKYIEKKQIIKENFEEKSLQPASYDIRLGDEGISSTTKELINIKEKKFLTIEAGEFAVFKTLEYFNIPLEIVGNIGMKSKYSRKGLILLAGLQIDPGFRGYLILRVFNTGTQRITISYQEPIGMVQFIKLIVPAEEYKGRYQDQVKIPPEDIEQITSSEDLTIGSVMKIIQDLVLSVKGLKDSQESLKEEWRTHEKRMGWIFMAIFGVLSIFIGIVALI